MLVGKGLPATTEPPGERPAGEAGTGVCALGGDALLLCVFAVTFNLRRGWQMLYFWIWL